MISPVFGIEPAHHVGLLHGEPKDAITIEDEGVRVLGVRIGHSVSVTAPDFGSSLPISEAVLPVNQMLPSLSSVRPWGPVCGS